MKLFLSSLTVALFLSISVTQADVIQLDCSAVFNVRQINTVFNGKVVPLTKDIDGAGGVATFDAAEMLGIKDPNCMPNDGKFPANERHPEVILPYADDDGQKFLSRRSVGVDTFKIDVPPKHFTKLHLFMASGTGASHVDIKLKYADGTEEVRPLDVLDWYSDLKPDNHDCYFLVSNLSKWGSTKQMERSHHAIFGLDLHPDGTKTLTSLEFSKTAHGIMDLFGATGETSD